MKSDGYENRVVAFLDILGFKQHLKKTVGNSDEFSKIFFALHYLHSQENHERRTKLLDWQITSFSDSIVISYPVKDQLDRFLIFDDLLLVQSTLTSLGLLVRGGVAIGDLYHEDNIIFGPAMVEAYELESKIAKYPRVVLSEKYFNLLAKSDGYNKFLNGRTKLDSDGFRFINFLSPDPIEKTFTPSQKGCVPKLEKRIEDTLRREKDPDIRSKMYWLENYVRWVKNEYGI